MFANNTIIWKRQFENYLKILKKNKKLEYDNFFDIIKHIKGNKLSRATCYTFLYKFKEIPTEIDRHAAYYVCMYVYPSNRSRIPVSELVK